MTGAPTRPRIGCGTVVLVIVGVLVMLRLVDGPRHRRSAEAPAPAAVTTPANDAVHAAALQKFGAMAPIVHAEWVGSDLWLAVNDNGRPWDAVANQTCAWLRGQGLQGAANVWVVEAAALANRRVQRLASAPCH